MRMMRAMRTMRIMSWKGIMIILGVALLMGMGSAGTWGNESPRLASYVTNDNREIFVGLFGQVALELYGCQNRKEALSLLGLSQNEDLLASTLPQLEEDYSLGQHPKLPCHIELMETDQEIQEAWPLDQALYADLNGSKRYYLEKNSGSGIFYSLPAHCSSWKEILKIRERISTPGVLRGVERPEEGTLRQEIPLFCGKGTPTHPPNPTNPTNPANPGDASLGTENSWRLYYTETYLNEWGDADLVYVLVQQKHMLPIHKIDGRKTTEFLWDPSSEETQKIESKLREVFQVKGGIQAPLEELPYQEMDRLPLYPFMEICLFQCDREFDFEHVYFPDPSSQEVAAVEKLSPLSLTNIYGEREWVWNYGKNRPQFLSFIGCSHWGRHFGLPMSESSFSSDGQAFLREMDQAIMQNQKNREGGAAFRCAPPAGEVCVRKVQDGEVLQPEHFRASGDCLQKKTLQIHLLGTAVVQRPLVIEDDGRKPFFSSVEILGKGRPGQEGSQSKILVQIKDRNSYRDWPSSACLFEKRPFLFHLQNLEKFKLQQVKIMVEKEAVVAMGKQWLGLQGESSQIVLDQTSWGEADSTVPTESTESIESMEMWDRNIRLCKSSFFSVNSQYRAQTFNVQGMNSRLLFFGSDSTQSQLLSMDSALILQSKSALRIHQTQLEGQRVIQIRDSVVHGSRSGLKSRKGPSSRAQALRLSGDSEVVMKFSSAKNFERVTLFLDRLGRVEFFLPTHDLKKDNEFLYGGEGSFEIIE